LTMKLSAIISGSIARQVFSGCMDRCEAPVAAACRIPVATTTRSTSPRRNAASAIDFSSRRSTALHSTPAKGGARPASGGRDQALTRPAKPLDVIVESRAAPTPPLAPTINACFDFCSCNSTRSVTAPVFPVSAALAGFSPDRRLSTVLRPSSRGGSRTVPSQPAHVDAITPRSAMSPIFGPLSHAGRP